MAPFDFKGPYELTDAHVDGVVDYMSPGAFTMGFASAPNGSFMVRKVGRSDSDLRQQLKQEVGKYDKFMFCYSYSSVAAFEDECKLYHQFNPTDNSAHPIRPTGSSVNCPYCGIVD